MYTARKYFKAEFSGYFTYLASEIARICPEKDPGYQRYRTSGVDTSNNNGNKRRISEAASGGRQHKKGRKENRVDISNTSRYYSPD